MTFNSFIKGCLILLLIVLLIFISAFCIQVYKTVGVELTLVSGIIFSALVLNAYRHIVIKILGLLE